VLNNREVASAVWLLVPLAVGLGVPSLREVLMGLVLALFQQVFVVRYAALAAWAGCLVMLAATIGLWDPGLAKDTLTWFVLSGLVLARGPTSTEAGEGFFRRACMTAVGLTAFLEFYGNLVVFPLIVELLLQPTLVFFLLMRSTPAKRPEEETVKNLFFGLSVVLSLVVLGVVTVDLVQSWNAVDKAESGRLLALPIWLTLGALPLVYLFGMLDGYEGAIRRAERLPKNGRTMWRVRAALFLGFRLSRDTAGFVSPWPERLADAPSLKEGLGVVGRYRARLRAKKALRHREAELLKRYAGVKGTDALGRQLDRREFKATRQALELLSVYQGAWYWNHKRRYGADLLTVFSDFTREGVPAEHGIAMQVSRSGQAWFAWRRCVTGWCFAIGCAGPPDRDCHYDGPEPPRGYPGSDPGWANGTGGRNANWT
jgi:hypothetical protein